MVDYPDGTLPVAIHIDFNVIEGDVDTKAERVEHKSAYHEGADGGNLIIPAAPEGKKVGLLMILVNADTDGAYFWINTLQGGVMTKITGDTYITAKNPVVLVFPAWIPEQDVSDGIAPNVEIWIAGLSCAARHSLFALYFYE